MENWQDKTTVKKGDFGEKITKDFLESKGFVCYKSITDSNHCFDFLGISKDKKTALIFEVKAKPKRKYFQDTGFNYKHFKEYKFFSKKYNLPVFVFFIDESLAECYGNFISELAKPFIDSKGKKYPSIENDIIYFPLQNMRRYIYTLNNKEIEFLKFHSTISKRYA